MIVPMTKYSFLVYHRDYENFLHNLRDLGVVHLIEKQSDISDDLREQYQQAESVEKVCRFLKKREVQSSSKSISEEGKVIFDKINELQSRLEHNNSSLTSIQKELNELLPWGNFSMDLLNQLKKNGINFRFFTIPAKKYDPSWETLYPIQVINNIGGNIYFVIVEKDHDTFEIPAEELRLPEYSPDELKIKLESISKEIQNIEKELDEYAAAGIPSLEKYKNNLLQQVEFRKAVFNTSREAEESLMILEGWVPEDREESLNAFLDKESVVYIRSEASNEDNIPILLKNKGFFNKFEIIGELYSLPTYSELDLTPFFAPFYALFFGFCLGDAGYGILMVLTALIAKRKINKELKPVAP